MVCNEVLTNSAEFGIISQRDFFDKDIANSENIDSYYIVEPNDFVYNPRISTLAPFGPIRRNKLNKSGAMSPLYYVFRTHNIDYGFLEYYFLTNRWHSFMHLNGNSGARSDRFAIRDEIFKQMPITMPQDIEEQKAIGEYFTILDHLITLHQRKCETLQKLKKSMLQKMFPKNGSCFPEIRFAGFTDAWEQREVSDVAEITAGGTPSTSVKEYWNPKQVPWLSSGEVHKKYITYTDDKISEEGLNHSSARMIKENSVLIALAGQGKTRGTVAINRIPLSTNQSIAAMTFTSEICPEFIFSNLENRYDELRRISSGDGTRGGLNKQLVGDVIIPYTFLKEQQAIGKFFTNLDHLITLHQRKLETLKKLKKAMLQKMFPPAGRAGI